MVDHNTDYLKNYTYRLYTKKDDKNTYFLDSELQNGQLVFKKIPRSLENENKNTIKINNTKEINNTFKIVNSLGILKKNDATPNQIREYYPDYKSQDEIEEEEKKKRDEEAKRKHDEEWEKSMIASMENLWKHNLTRSRNLYDNKRPYHDGLIHLPIPQKRWEQFYDDKIKEIEKEKEIIGENAIIERDKQIAQDLINLPHLENNRQNRIKKEKEELIKSILESNSNFDKSKLTEFVDIIYEMNMYEGDELKFDVIEKYNNKEEVINNILKKNPEFDKYELNNLINELIQKDLFHHERINLGGYKIEFDIGKETDKVINIYKKRYLNETTSTTTGGKKSRKASRKSKKKSHKKRPTKKNKKKYNKKKTRKH